MSQYDVIIVGAGAAGLMCAIQCHRPGSRILLVDSQPKIGAKILMSGGTRCNVTNRIVTERDYHSENLTIVKHILAAFPPEKAVHFFESRGVTLVEEPGGKLFPETHQAQTILESLKKAVAYQGVVLTSGFKVQAVLRVGNTFQVHGLASIHESACVVLCTGGLSYPSSGSDGGGYSIARSLGHSLISTTPALTPLLTEDKDWKTLMGLSVFCRLAFWEDGKKKAFYDGPLLFTHFGFSGPSALNISRHWVRSPGKDKKISVNFLPEDSEEALRRVLMPPEKKGAPKTVKSILIEKLPRRLAEFFLKEMEILEATKVSELTRERREKMIRFLYHYPLEVSGVYGYKKAEATAGGVPLTEINPKTMESKIQPGLFFAGEILDVDGQIGGFNFQWAWSSAAVAARGIQQFFERSSKPLKV